mmetsp:Transcript_43281/g.106863  ORF Transcript_43281/g.106863 Transcript_43281/m.106863 type:complete len:327 (+) Transcript_43281:4825-5805(+)
MRRRVSSGSARNCIARSRADTAIGLPCCLLKSSASCLAPASSADTTHPRHPLSSRGPCGTCTSCGGCQGFLPWVLAWGGALPGLPRPPGVACLAVRARWPVGLPKPSSSSSLSSRYCGPEAVNATRPFASTRPTEPLLPSATPSAPYPASAVLGAAPEEVMSSSRGNSNSAISSVAPARAISSGSGISSSRIRTVRSATEYVAPRWAEASGFIRADSSSTAAALAPVVASTERPTVACRAASAVVPAASTAQGPSKSARVSHTRPMGSEGMPLCASRSCSSRAAASAPSKSNSPFSFSWLAFFKMSPSARLMASLSEGAPGPCAPR